MTNSNRSGPSAFDSDYNINEIDEILRQNDDYIVAMAREKLPRHIASPEVLDLEIQELAQRSRIKLWKALQHRHIRHIKAYIRCIVHSASVDMVRNYKPDLPLPLDEEGELYQGNVLVAFSEGMQDPLYELEKEQLDDVSTLTQAFKKFEVNIEAVRYPSKKKEVQNLKASLSIARRKLRALKLNRSDKAGVL